MSHPNDLRWADPDCASTEGERELIIAIGNLTQQVMRIADHFDNIGGPQVAL